MQVPLDAFSMWRQRLRWFKGGYLFVINKESIFWRPQAHVSLFQKLGYCIGPLCQVTQCWVRRCTCSAAQGCGALWAVAAAGVARAQCWCGLRGLSAKCSAGRRDCLSGTLWQHMKLQSSGVLLHCQNCCFSSRPAAHVSFSTMYCEL
jgi:hypothetical protein